MKANLLNLFLVSIALLMACKEEKKDPAILFLEKVYSFKDYAEYLKTPQAKAFRERVEKESEQYRDDFWSLVPEEFHVKTSVVAADNSFYTFEKILVESSEFESYHVTDDYITKLNTKSDFSEIAEYLNSKLETVKNALAVLTDKFEWAVNEDSYSKAGLKLRAFCRVLNLKFLLDVYQGDWKEAVNTLDMHVVFLNALESCKGDLIVRQLGYAAHNLTNDTIINALSNKDISKEHIKAIMGKYKEIKVPRAENMLSTLAYNFEIAVKLCAASKVSPKEYFWMILYPVSRLSENPEEFKKWFDTQYEKRIPFDAKKYINDHVVYYQLFFEDLKNVCHPDDMLSKKIVDDLDKTEMENLNNYFCSTYFGALQGTKSVLNNVLTRKKVVELVAKIRIYEIENNKLPERLSDLFDGDSAKIPGDLNSRDLLMYSRENREITVRPRPKLTKLIKF